MTRLKVYLDDVRPEPSGWCRARSAEECIGLLSSNVVETLSLDHDLGHDEETGASVVRWMIENSVWPELIILHTMNPVGLETMRSMIVRHAPGSVLLEVRIGWSGDA